MQGAKQLRSVQFTGKQDPFAQVRYPSLAVTIVVVVLVVVVAVVLKSYGHRWAHDETPRCRRPFALTQVTVELPGVDAERLGDSSWVGTKVYEDGGDAAEWEQALVVGVDDAASSVLHVRVRRPPPYSLSALARAPVALHAHLCRRLPPLDAVCDCAAVGGRLRSGMRARSRM